mgnify:FL=1
MIDEKKITEAVDAYIGYPKEVGEGVDVSMRRDAFREGAKWFKEALWHDAKEEPDKHKFVLVQWFYMGRYGADMIKRKYYWQGYIEEYHIIKWCYIDDLLPKGSEE